MVNYFGERQGKEKVQKLILNITGACNTQTLNFLEKKC